jgi:hypothetical protein
MEKPPSYVHNDSKLVCFLQKYLYGPKQAPQAWYAKVVTLRLFSLFP